MKEYFRHERGEQNYLAPGPIPFRGFFNVTSKAFFRCKSALIRRREKFTVNWNNVFFIVRVFITAGRYIVLLPKSRYSLLPPISPLSLSLHYNSPPGREHAKFHSHLRYPAINNSLMNITIKLNISGKPFRQISGFTPLAGLDFQLPFLQFRYAAGWLYKRRAHERRVAHPLTALIP